MGYSLGLFREIDHIAGRDIELRVHLNVQAAAAAFVQRDLCGFQSCLCAGSVGHKLGIGHDVFDRVQRDSLQPFTVGTQLTLVVSITDGFCIAARRARSDIPERSAACFNLSLGSRSLPNTRRSIPSRTLLVSPEPRPTAFVRPGLLASRLRAATNAFGSASCRAAMCDYRRSIATTEPRRASTAQGSCGAP